MSRTFFQDFVKDNGQPVTVEFSYSGGSETTYSPHSGASGGDGCEVMIVSVMPNTPEYEALCRRSLDLSHGTPGTAHDGPIHPGLIGPETRAELVDLDEQIEAAKSAVALTDAENERMCDWIAEHHIDEPDDDMEF